MHIMDAFTFKIKTLDKQIFMKKLLRINAQQKHNFFHIFFHSPSTVCHEQ